MNHRSKYRVLTAWDWKQLLEERTTALAEARSIYELATTEEEKAEASVAITRAERLVKLATTKVQRFEANEKAVEERLIKAQEEALYVRAMKELGEATAEVWKAEDALVQARKRHEEALRAVGLFHDSENDLEEVSA